MVFSMTRINGYAVSIPSPGARDKGYCGTGTGPAFSPCSLALGEALHLFVHLRTSFSPRAEVPFVRLARARGRSIAHVRIVGLTVVSFMGAPVTWFAFIGVDLGAHKPATPAILVRREALFRERRPALRT